MFPVPTPRTDARPERPACAELLLVVLMAFGASPIARAEPFRLLAWNVESNRPGAPPVSDPTVIAARLEALSRAVETKAAIVVLSEVDPRTVPAFRDAVVRGGGGRPEAVLSASGGFRDKDSVLVLVDADRFHVADAYEIHRHGGISANMLVAEAGEDEGTLRARSPLALRLVDRVGGAAFWLVAVHLARGEEALRTDQARMLCRWASDRSEPLILAGDCNLDFDLRTRRGNAAWQVLHDSQVWRWLEPDPLVDTNWADDRNAPPGERRDRYPDSLLDFIFVANGAASWAGESDVIVEPGDFPDDDATSDHRPVVATFDPGR